ncbi:FHA domain-containing protein At4g14490-like [Magnolia sinica]|uniref:FHA domain-containing protein At4g14490-like n=1 Tax=Magnolia sinica TaxID=86752 RepID=UPI0026581BE5|nr:FHA domain-containing protein At4g14490-like [Magnolia sinica]
MEEAKNPTLKLTIDKGPRQGETLESRPELSSIRIGRVIRGNTFTIKDPAISQKHLEIVLTAGKWSVSDLDTSNGTFLNDVKLHPLSPSSLSDGDTIKIGQATSISVRIDSRSDPGPDPLENQPQRNKGRQGRQCKGRAKARIVSKDDPVLLESVTEKSNLGLDTSITVKVKEKSDLENALVENGLRRNPRRRAAPNKGRITSEDELTQLESVPVKKVAETSDRVREDTTAIEENSAVPKELEKITLGEWFDRMERYLPKQINDITEEIIQSLRQRHKQFEEFIEQQQDGKGKLAVAN